VNKESGDKVTVNIGDDKPLAIGFVCGVWKFQGEVEGYDVYLTTKEVLERVHPSRVRYFGGFA
jgi:hypothetical protein